MEILGYIASILMGMVLGLIGGGGSILTVPILVYLFDFEPLKATSYSLFIVGITSFIGAISYMKKSEASFSTFAIFALPAIISVYITRSFIIRAIPFEIFTIGNFIFTRDIFILVLFAVLMIAAAISMIKSRKDEVDSDEIKNKFLILAAEGIAVGLLTGLVGAGGGFLIIPALVLLAKLPIKKAIGTSLMIISVNSAVGFIGDLDSQSVINWQLLAIFSSLAIVGVIAGSSLSNFIDGKKLKPAFGWFIMAMGIYIITREIFLK